MRTITSPLGPSVSILETDTDLTRIGDPTFQSSSLVVGDARTLLGLFPDDTFQCVVTSPPYWSLRDYNIHGHSEYWIHGCSFRLDLRIRSMLSLIAWLWFSRKFVEY